MAQAEKGLSITENILTSDPDIVAIFAANDPPALGALQALKAAGRDDVLIVGFDGTKDGLQAVKDGDFAADVLQFPDAMGIIGVDLMVRHLNGEDDPGAGRFRLRSGHGGERRPVPEVAAQEPSRAIRRARLGSILVATGSQSTVPR